MRQPARFGTNALIVLGVVEVASLITIAVAAAKAQRVSAIEEPTHAERPDRAKRHQRTFDDSMPEPHRIAQ